MKDNIENIIKQAGEALIDFKIVEVPSYEVKVRYYSKDLKTPNSFSCYIHKTTGLDRLRAKIKSVKL